MNITLIGYGKMGHAIETIALERGHRIALIIDQHNREALHSEAFRQTDVAIEFTHPDSAVENLLACFRAGVPVVCGSTGWLPRWNEVAASCNEQQAGLLYASNFSIGVNIFFSLNQKLAKLMAGHPEYQLSVEEIHHTAKKDAPSGTAITLAEDIIRLSPGKTGWINAREAPAHLLPIHSIREDPAPGTHRISYRSPVDDIDIIHTAHNRKGFATGAVLAAEFMQQKKGIYSMQDVLQLH